MASVQVTKVKRKPPQWLLEVTTEDGDTIHVILTKAHKTIARKFRWGLSGPGIAHFFPSRPAALKAASELRSFSVEDLDEPQADS